VPSIGGCPLLGELTYCATDWPALRRRRCLRILPTWSEYLVRWWEEDLEANQQSLLVRALWYASTLSSRESKSMCCIVLHVRAVCGVGDDDGSRLGDGEF
jgi:hypothetical protein